MFLIVYEIASLIAFVRKDITTQSLEQAIQLVLFVIAMLSDRQIIEKGVVHILIIGNKKIYLYKRNKN
jgi:hypothetical protein